MGEDRSIRWLLIVVMSLGGGLVVWGHIQGGGIARRCEALRRESWAGRRANWSPSDDAARSLDSLRAISGVVLNEQDECVAGAQVLLVDLDRLQKGDKEVALTSAIPEGCIERRTLTGPKGDFAFDSPSIGPKALLATSGLRSSYSRWVHRVLDGLPLRACDIRVMPDEPMRVRVDGLPEGRRIMWSPVYDEFYPAPVPSTELVRGYGECRCVAGSRPSYALLHDLDEGVSKVVPIEFLPDGTAWARVECPWGSLPLPGVPDGSITCEMDDLDFGIPRIAIFNVRVRDGLAQFPLVAGHVGVSLGLPGGFVHATATVDGQNVRTEGVERRESSVDIPVELSKYLGGDSIQSAVATLPTDNVVRGCGEDRLSLVRRDRRVGVRIQGCTVLMSDATVARFPRLQVVTGKGTVLLFTVKLCGAGRGVEVSPIPLGRGDVEVDCPWSYSWVRLLSDDGTVQVGRAAASGEIVLHQVSQAVPFVIQCDEGPFGWNRYAFTGGCLQGTGACRVTVSRATERPVRSGRAEIYGFVTGPTAACRVVVYCQPIGNPRGVRRQVLEDSPFYDFVVDPGSGYVVVAWPEDKEYSQSVQYIKSLSTVPILAEGQNRRVDLELGQGTMRFRDDSDLVGGRMELVRASQAPGEVVRSVWSWKHSRGQELRNVPSGKYWIRRADCRKSDSDTLGTECMVTNGKVADVSLLKEKAR